MPKPTMVSFKNGSLKEGYTFGVTDDESKEFTCWYDGTAVKLSIFVSGTLVTDVLSLVVGLFQPGSDFKTKLFEHYPNVQLKELNKISFESTTGYKFEVVETSDVYELMKEYYRSYRYEIKDGDTEEDIVQRHKKVFYERLKETFANSSYEVAITN